MSGRTLFDGLRAREVRLPAVAEPGTVLLEAQGVTVAYGGHTVLEDISVEIRAGEVFALIGPNGAGKSTLLGVLSGDQTASAGAVLIDGKPLSHWGANELAVRRGVLLQQVDVSFPFTVTQVVRMGRAPWAGTDAEEFDDEIIADALIEVDTAHLAPRVYRTLSGGERSRAACARVLAQEPMALLLDEPTASLDIGHQELILGVARQRAGRGDGVVVVLHDLGLAAAYADRVMVIDAGKMVAVGSPDEVLTPSLLSSVWRHRIEVLRHPRTGHLIIQPEREPIEGSPFGSGSQP